MIGKALKAIIDADASANALFAGRIYPGKASQSPTQPYAVYTLISGDHVQSLTAHSGLAWSIYQINVFDDQYADAHDGAEKIRLALQDASGTYASIVIADIYAYGGDHDDEGTTGDGRETKVRSVARDYKVWYTQA